ncbi:hypothetical protein BYT27DRAFT_7335939 [Phlegmacium glaucopus]|nr:hypothetical protein BYT27DRAFT_7335939 [Phlegmacium glaucopus]
MTNSNPSVEVNIVEVPADRTTDSPNNNDIQEMDRGEDNRRAQKIYYIQNYYMNSFNNHKLQMRNCGNRRRTTDIYRAGNDVDEFPYPKYDEASSGPTPSTGPDSHPNITNPLLQTQMRHNPNISVPPQQPVGIAVRGEVPKEIADVPPLSTNYQRGLDPAKSPRPVPPSDSSDSNVEHLEHLDSSLAPVSSIQLSGNTSSSPSNSGLVVPSTSRSHILIPVHCFMLFLSSVLFLILILHHTVAD